MMATDSGWLSFNPRACLLRARSAATTTNSFSVSRGDRCMLAEFHKTSRTGREAKTPARAKNLSGRGPVQASERISGFLKEDAEIEAEGIVSVGRIRPEGDVDGITRLKLAHIEAVVERG